MAERKSYTSRQAKPYVFDVDGTEFSVSRRVPGAAFLDFMRSLRGFGDKGQTPDMGAVVGIGDDVYEMYAAIMEPEEFERFWKFCKSADGPGFETLIEILTDCVAEDTDRPTEPSAS